MEVEASNHQIHPSGKFIEIREKGGRVRMKNY
jgi:hypothetical protein